MKHVDTLETTGLPDRLGRELAAGAPCVAVVIESADGQHQDARANAERGTGGRPTRRSSASIFRVGDGFVVTYDDATGDTETIALRSDQFEEYVERARRDGDWTVLSIAGEGATGRRGSSGGEFPVRR